MAKPAVRDLVEAVESRKIEEFILDAWGTRREYLMEWTTRIRKLDAFIIGDWAVEMPDGRIIRDRPKIEDRVLTKMEDSGYLAGSILPTIRVEPINDRDYTGSEKRERVLHYYWQMSEMKTLLPRLYMDLIGTGLFAIQVWPDFQQDIENRFPQFKRLDPRFILPPLDYVLNGEIEPHDVITHRQVKTRFLARKYPDQMSRLQAVAEKIAQSYRGSGGGQQSRQRKSNIIVDTSQVMLLEYWGRDAIMRVALIDQYPESAVVLENEYNATECCPVVLGVRPTADGRIRGKVESMMPSLAAENRLMTYVLDYTDQAVYSPLVKTSGVINAEDIGPNAIIDLGAASAGEHLERMPPANINPEVFKIIQDLERHSRMSGTLPMSRGGDVNQSQASSTFVEALNSGLTTEIGTYQSVMESCLRRANVIAQDQDKVYCNTEKMIYGLAKGGSYREKYTPEILLKDTANLVTYGVVAGLDEMNAEIRISQRQKSGYASRRWVMENLSGIENITQEESRMADEAALSAFMQGMLAKAGQGDLTAFGAFMQARDSKDGDMLAAIHEIAKSNPSILEPVLQPGPAPRPGTAQGEVTALQKGAMPGVGAPATPGTPEGSMPPLASLLTA